MQGNGHQDRARRRGRPVLGHPMAQSAALFREGPVLHPMHHSVGAARTAKPEAQAPHLSPATQSREGLGGLSRGKQRPSPSARGANSRDFVQRQRHATLPTQAQAHHASAKRRKPRDLPRHGSKQWTFPSWNPNDAPPHGFGAWTHRPFVDWSCEVWQTRPPPRGLGLASSSVPRRLRLVRCATRGQRRFRGHGQQCTGAYGTGRRDHVDHQAVERQCLS